MKLLSIQLFLSVFFLLSISTCCGLGDDGFVGPPRYVIGIFDSEVSNQNIFSIYPQDSVLFFESDNSTLVEVERQDEKVVLYGTFGERTNNLFRSTFFIHLPNGAVDTLVGIAADSEGRCGMVNTFSIKVDYNSSGFMYDMDYGGYKVYRSN